MNFQEYLKNIKPYQIEDPVLSYIAETCGVDVAIMLITEFSGTEIRVPKLILNQLKDSYIKEKCDGTKLSIKQLTAECGYNERYVRRLLKLQEDEPGTEQLNLLEVCANG